VAVLGEWRHAMILLWLFFFSWCRDTAVVLEEQTMASLMKTVVSLPLRFPSSLFLPPHLLFFFYFWFRSSPSLLFFVVFFCFLYSVLFLPSLSLFFSSLLPPFSSFFFLLWFLCIISLSLLFLFFIFFSLFRFLSSLFFPQFFFLFLSLSVFCSFSSPLPSKIAPLSFLYLSVFIASGSESNVVLSYHGAGQGGVRQLCTVAPATTWHGSLLLLTW